MTPIADYLNFTSSWEDRGHLQDGLRDICAEAEAFEQAPGHYRFPNRGVLKFKRLDGRHDTRLLTSLSGRVLSSLRAANLMRDLLMVLGVEPHKLTMLHVALDVPGDASPHVEHVAEVCGRGELSLTRKRVNPAVAKTLRAANGRYETFYSSPKRTADVQLVVYDKALERSVRGDPDYPPTARYELRFTDRVGFTLADVEDPTALFWQFMPPTLLPRPADVPDWEPFRQSFTLPRRSEPTTYERMKRQLNAPAVRTLLDLAASQGEHGLRDLQMLIAAAYRQRAAAPADQAA
jgi:hypothetical protein